MKYTIKLFFIFGFIFIISACATPVFTTTHVNKKLTPDLAINSFNLNKDQYVLWGGTLLSGTNFKDSTELEILAYPLDDYSEPIENSKSFGRFIAIDSGYLELGEYAKDRQVSFVGQLVELRKGKVGDSDYVYPVIAIQQIKLWPIEKDIYYDDHDVRFHFGVGIFHRY